MANGFDELAAARQQNRVQQQVAQPVAPAPSQPVAPQAEPEPRPRGRPKTGKRDNPEYRQWSGFIRDDTLRRVRIVFQRGRYKGTESDLVETLLSRWADHEEGRLDERDATLRKNR